MHLLLGRCLPGIVHTQVVFFGGGGGMDLNKTQGL